MEPATGGEVLGTSNKRRAEVGACVCLRVCMCVSVCVRACVRACMHVHVYTHVHSGKPKQCQPEQTDGDAQTPMLNGSLRAIDSCEGSMSLRPCSTDSADQSGICYASNT